MGREPEHGLPPARTALMELKWTSKALSDVVRLYEFLAAVNPLAAAQTVQQLTEAPAALLANPRLGERLDGRERAAEGPDGGAGGGEDDGGHGRRERGSGSDSDQAIRPHSLRR